MSDTVIIPTGKRISVNGQRWQLTESPEVSAIAIDPDKVQKNQHLALDCPSAECQTRQAELIGRKNRPTLRTTAVVDSPKLKGQVDDDTIRPFCGLCGTRMIWRNTEGL